MDKAGLRRELKNQRQKLSPEEVAKLSQQIINNAWEIIDWSKIQSAHVYLPIKANNEIDTLPLLKAARQLNPELKIAYSDINGQTHWLDEKLQPAKKVPENFQYGRIIVPMLAFNNNGYRLGYGGGFYDRFLADQSHALTIGLCYEFGHTDKLKIEPHDISIKTIVTEKTIYRF